MPLTKIRPSQPTRDRLSTPKASNDEQHLRKSIESRLSYLRDSNSPEEFNYVVNAELLRATSSRHFGLPVKHLFQRVQIRVQKVFKPKNKIPCIYEQLNRQESNLKPVTPMISDILKSNAKPTWENNPQALAATLLAY